jgi:hypothetical protein
LPNRNLTTRAQVDCEVLGLSKEDIMIMRMEFNDEFSDLVKDTEKQMIKCLQKGMDAAKKCI